MASAAPPQQTSPKPAAAAAPPLVLVASESPPKIFIEDRKIGKLLIIAHTTEDDQDSLNCEISATTNITVKPRDSPKPIFGVIGAVRFLSGYYIIGISSATRVTVWLGCDLFAVSKVALTPVTNSAQLLSEEDRKKERDLVGSFTEFLEEGGFYFASQPFDLTNSFQRQWALPADQRMQRSAWHRADQRFLWNRHLAQPLLLHSPGIVSWLTPIIQGHITVAETQLQGRSLRYALISRRSAHRAGPRLLTRGADPRGFAANYVETEQVVELDGNISAFVQTRVWDTRLYTSLVASVSIDSVDETKAHPRQLSLADFQQLRTMSRHFEEQSKLYGRQLVVSLIDHHGIEADLAEAFEAYTKLLNNSNVRYIGWDFHEATRGNKYENTVQLLELVRQDLLANGYFLGAATGDVVLQQSGVARVNCLDCLDRTNVAESVFARMMLQVQLENLGLMKRGDRIEQAAPELETLFKNTWVANANSISMEYTGTGALKTEFTRTGNWSLGGALGDGLSSAKRYLQQNFYDEGKHVQYQLAQGELEFFSPSLALKEGAADGVFRFRAGRGGSARVVPPVYGLLLELDTIRRTFTTYVLEERRRKCVPLSSVQAIERCARNLRTLRLTLEHTPAPKEYDFKTVRLREEFAQVLSSLLNPDSPELLVLGDNTAAPTASPYFETVQVHVLYWDMEETPSPPSSLASLIPRGCDVYFVATRNCSYRMPEDPLCSLRPPGHFQLLVHSFLGAEYERVAVAAGEQIILALYVKHPLWPHCHNIETYIVRDPRVRVRPSPQRRAVSPTTAGSSASPSLKTSLETPGTAYTAAVAAAADGADSPAPVTTSFFNMVKGRLLSSPARQSTPNTASPAAAPASPATAATPAPASTGGGNAVGAAIGLSIHDTTVCVLATAGDCELLRLDGADLMRDFHHVLWAGATPAAATSMAARCPDLWTPLQVPLPAAGVLYRTQLPLLAPQSLDVRVQAADAALIDFGGSATATRSASVPLVRCAFDFSVTASADPLSPKRQPSNGAATNSALPNIVLSDSTKQLEQLEITNEGPITRKASRGPPPVNNQSASSPQPAFAVPPPVALALPLSVFPSHYGIHPPCRLCLRQLRPVPGGSSSPFPPPKSDVFVQVDGAFLESVGSGTSFKTTGSWEWPDVDLQPFITDREYLRRRALTISVLSPPDLLGNRTPLGYGRLPLSVFIDAQGAALEFQLGLRLEDEPVGRLAGFGTMIFYDSFKAL